MNDSGSISHDNAFELLPWLVNGSLAAAERELVDEHVRSCIVCRREIKTLERLATAVRSQPTVLISAQGQFEQLERRLGKRFEPFRGWHPAFFRFATVAVVGVGLLGALLWLAPHLNTEQNDFATLSAPADGDAQLDLIFNPSTTDTQIRQLLAEIDGTIVAGPTELGRYSVRLRRPLGDAELATMLERLAKDPRIRFAGRSYVKPTP